MLELSVKKKELEHCMNNDELSSRIRQMNVEATTVGFLRLQEEDFVSLFWLIPIQIISYIRGTTLRTTCRISVTKKSSLSKHYNYVVAFTANIILVKNIIAG